MLQLNTIPPPARIFGLAGLLPFFAGAILCWLPPTSESISVLPAGSFVLLAYGAVILSFLGGIRWGIAMQHEAMISNWQVVAWAMAPSLLAWTALLVAPTLGFILLIAGFSLQWSIDYRANKQSITPPWFLTLRTILTLGAVVSLVVGAIGTL